MPGNLRLVIIGGLVYGLLQSSAIAFDVSTYHYDALRTGWNNQETTLTPAAVKSVGGPTGTGRGFRLLKNVPLDERVNAQPLLITNQSISNVGVHDVVYVVTANNTVYAIDATTGALLKTRNFGQPVAGCGPSGKSILGILSTPVIDRQAQVMYLVTETLEDGDVVATEVDPVDPKNPRRDRIDPPQIDVRNPLPGRGPLIPRIPFGKHPEYKIHAIDLSTLADKLTPRVVSGLHQLTDGQYYKFSSLNSRQRPALVYANGSIYAAFSAACEMGDRSRGWLLGWDAAHLFPLPGNELIPSGFLTNSLEPYPFPPPPGWWGYMSGIWMSGFGVAADASGNLFFVTGNSGANTYGKDPPLGDGARPYNFANSVMKVSGDLTRVIDYFAPADVNTRDENDADFGSGGVLLMPDQTGSKPRLAVAAGKPWIPNSSAEMFLLDRDNLGGYAPPRPGNNVLWYGLIGPCLCGPSYFVGSDSTPRIVSSGGTELIIWKVQTDPAPALVQEHAAVMDPNVGPLSGSGFFTSVSSNGLTPDTAVIWAVHDQPPRLYAFNAATGTQIGSWPAGSWGHGLGIYTIVPVVANGKVYVASDHQLSIFGLGPRPLPHFPVSQFSPSRRPISQNPNVVEGEVRAMHGSRITMATSAGREIQVDVSNAVENHLSIPFAVGNRITVDGRRDKNGIVQAYIITYPEPYP
jgi:outer membrane protein assembly factor BamB